MSIHKIPHFHTSNLRISASTHINTSLHEEYEIDSTILGKGKYGHVYQCSHRSTGLNYAIKTIEKSKTTSREQIQCEIQLLRSVCHPYIIKLVNCFEDSRCIYIITEICNGGELFYKIVEYTTESGCFPEQDATKIITSLLDAVEYLHSNDIVHRDIKPENVLLESNKDSAAIKLIDFGLSTTHGINDDLLTDKVGTAYYMSPSILKGRYDRSCDVWAIGIITYTLLSGYPPFNGDTEEEIHQSIMKCDVPFERGIWINLSRSARDFVSKMLSKDDSSAIRSAKQALCHPWIQSL